MKDLRLGMIGTGGIAVEHLPAVEKDPDARYVAFCDVDRARAEPFLARFEGAQFFSDFREMFDTVELDGVVITVPPYAHGEIELEAVRHRVPFLVEKPIGIGTEVPRRVLQAVEQARLLTCVGYMSRYRRSVNAVREHLKSDPPAVVLGCYVGGIPGVEWWRRRDRSGGQINEQSTHVFDLLRYLCGPVERVYAEPRRGLITDVEGYDLDDASVVTLRFADGTIATVATSCALRGPGGRIGIDIYTRRGRLTLEGWEFKLVCVVDSRAWTIEPEKNIFEIQDRAFLSMLRSGRQSEVLCSYAEAFETQRLTTAVERALRSSGVVRL